MPGLMKGIGYLKMDESRHIAYGTYLLQRLIIEHGNAIYDVIQKRMTELMPYCVGIMTELPKRKKNTAAPNGNNAPQRTPFDLDPKEFADFAVKQIQVRLDILRRSCNKSLEDWIREQELESILV
jgi:ribonucleoside-diphosphate reductase beta chain